MKYQVTLFSTSGKYRPVASIVTTTEKIDISDRKARAEVMTKGVQKICYKRGWSKADLTRYEYTKYKMREVE